MLKGRLGLYTLAAQARPAHLGLGRVRIPSLLRQAAWSSPPAADTEFGSVLVAYDAGAGTKRTRRNMHKRWSKLALRASLPKRIRRALVLVMDKLADSTVAAVRGVVADRIGVPLDGKCGWVFDKVFLKLTAAPQKK